MIQQEQIVALEAMVDASSLGDVLLSLARMCNEKAEHVRCNWQDEATARMWDNAAKLLDKTYTKLPV